MQNALWSSEVALEPDNIDNSGENTSFINRFALLSFQAF